jgi:ubiquinone/menaquinone biosynthesis C-methylase UbiE
MDHADHVALIGAGVLDTGPRWLDLGAGTGAFTLALLELLGDDADVVAVDRDERALDALRASAAARFPGRNVTTRTGDFTTPLPVDDESFDGLLMANSLHFVRDKEPVLRRAVATLRPRGRFVLVEYGADTGNPWVPFPISFGRWTELAERVGLHETRRIGEVPSRFLGSIYAAVSTTPGQA